MLEIVYFSLISGLVFEVAVTADAGGQQSILEHPLHGNVSCSSVCPPQKSRDNDIVFCHDNCPGYWNWMISVIFADTSERVNRANDCTEYNFTHVPSNSVIPCSNFRNNQNATEDVKKFWSRNCISYFVCVIGKNIDFLLGSNISSITLSSADPTGISSSEQPSQSSLPHLVIVLIALGVLCIALCGCLTVLIIRLRRHKPLRRGEHSNDDVALQIGLLNAQPATNNPTVTDTSERDVERYAESRPHVQEVGDCSLSTGALSTTPKETHSSRISLHSERIEETQQNHLDDLSSLGPRAVPPDMSLDEVDEHIPSFTQLKQIATDDEVHRIMVTSPSRAEH